MRRVLTLAASAGLAVWSTAAFAHFPFLHLKTEGGTPELHVYFAESAEPDDPSLLDRLAGADVWEVRGDGTTEPLTVKKGESSLETPVAKAGPAAFALQKDYGVLSRNGESFSLVYYAKTFAGPEAWEISPGERSRLDLVPRRDGEQLTLTVLWNGKPLADAEVTVQGGVDFEEGKTDAEGRFTCKTTGRELYSIRAKHVEAAAGEKDGKKFDATRHYATLTLDLK